MSAEQHRQVADALARLLQAGEHSFVIVHLAGTDKFVQFVAPADGWLMLDVPEQSLSKEERRRAEVFFADIGDFDDELQAFCAVLTEGPEAAAGVALDALRAVHQAPPDAAISIESHFTAAEARGPGAAVCSLCGEPAERLERRLWFRGTTESLLTRQAPVQLQQVCDSCLAACRRRTRINLTVLVVVLAIAAGLIAAAAVLAP